MKQYKTFGELFKEGLKSNFNKLKEITGGVIYGISSVNQMYIIFVENNEDLCDYYECDIVEFDETPNYTRPVLKVAL